jgi:FkbM family methyltransferase
MFGKLSRLIQLFDQYGFGALRLIFYPLIGKDVWVKYEDEIIWFNYDKSTYYHLLHSMGKLKRLVESIPDDIEGVIIDGGANHGIFSVLAAKRFPEKDIYAIEPYRKVLPFLEKNAKGKNIQIIKKALAEKDGEVAFFTSDVSDQMGSVIKENVSEFIGQDDLIREEKLPAISLDTLIKQEGISKIGVLKLDVQGSEFRILKNGDEVLAITDNLLLEVTFIEKSTLELLEKVKNIYPYYAAINSIIYGADIIFSKKPVIH